MSSYQADWFMDEEGKLDFASKGDADGFGGTAGKEDEEEEEDGNSIAEGGDDDDMFTTGAASSALKGSGGRSVRTLQERLADEEVFPDEMDTPMDVSARTRFARYRALLSFRASPWHPKENLPAEYSRIFQFENFSGTQRRLADLLDFQHSVYISPLLSVLCLSVLLFAGC